MSWFRRLGVATLKDGMTPVLCVGAGVSASTATAVLCDKQSDAEDLARLKARGPPPPPQGTNGGRYYLRWCDNFDYTGHPDARRWNSQVESNNWVRDQYHNELQWYTGRRPENAWVSDGTLKITARREDKWADAPYTSARLNTRGKGDFKYGRIEVCAKLPPSVRGVWPAIWLRPSDSFYGFWPKSGEIDICELVGHTPDVLHASVHTGNFNHRQKSHRSATRRCADAATEFHVHALEWDEDEIRIFLDDECYFRFANSHTGDPGDWPFDQPFHVTLNVAVGGNWGGSQGIDHAGFPVALEVAYVRVYQRTPGRVVFAPGHTGGAEKNEASK